MTGFLTSDRRVFVDTAAYYGLVDTGDNTHAAARGIVTWLGREHWQPHTSNFIRAETHALLLNRLGRHYASRFLAELATSSSTLIRVSEADEEQALAILDRYGDKQFSLTDATSFAIMERLGITHAVTFKNFTEYGRFIVLAPP